MNNNQSDDQEKIGHRQQNDQANEIAGSPVSQSNSSSSRQHRIVELLPENDNNDDQSADWIIRPEFYNEDVVQNHSDNLSTDETDDEPSLHDLDDLHDEDSEDDNYDNPDAILDGYVIAPYEDDQSTTDTDGDSDQSANYDTTLPVSHRYLGDNLEESRGRRVLAEGSIVNLPLFNLKDIVLFPGQVLPITTSNLSPNIQRSLRDCVNRGSTTIGLMFEPQINPIGTTAEIRNFSIEADELRLIMEGRQRFKLLSAPFETAIEGEVRILPEVTLGPPYPRISSLLRFFTTVNKPNKFIISKHPYWILKRYEARNVMALILDHIKDWSNADMTKDPNDFSYWVAANLPIRNNERMEALSFSCTEARLRWLLDMLERCEFFGCLFCKNVICYKKDVFPMSSSGPQCSFVNPGGFIHDTLTVRSARGLIQEYGWSREFSWFPGYTWRMANCENCHRHIGWCYKRVGTEIKPKKFFGLSRANVMLIGEVPTDNT